MIRIIGLCALTLLTTACAFPAAYDPDPTSPAQWQRRQEDIQRREAERVRLCQIMNRDSERYERECRRPGDPNR